METRLKVMPRRHQQVAEHQTRQQRHQRIQRCHRGIFTCADVLRLHLESPPEAIVHALAVIREFGGAEEYLRAHGLRSDQLAALRRKEGVSA